MRKSNQAEEVVVDTTKSKKSITVKEQVNILSNLFSYLEPHTESGLFENQGSLLAYCYNNEIIENCKDGFGVYDEFSINQLAQVDTKELINTINYNFLENGLEYLDIAIVLSILANFWLRKNGNISFFSFVYELIITNDMCGIVFAKELLLHTFNIENLREDYPEYPILNLTGEPNGTAKVYIPLSAISEYFQNYPDYPHTNIVNEATQTMLVYIPLEELDECIDMYPDCVIDTLCFSNDYFNGGN